MKLTTILSSALLLLTLIVSCSSSGVKEPDGERPPGPVVLEKYIPLADPFILLYDGLYYAYGTSSDNGFEVFYSRDLAYWQKHPEWLLHKDDSYSDRWFWAPEVFYNADDKTFYLYYSADEHICVATSDSPLGPFTQELKEPMRSEKSIDSTLFIDDDGTPYIFFVRFTGGNVIWGAELERDWKTIKEETLTKCIEVSEPWESIEGKVAEGPSVVKTDGVYYMLYSANDYRSRDYGVGYARADSPLGRWTKAEENPILHRPHPELVGAGHGAPFRDKEGNWRYVFHAHSTPSAVQPRKMNITDMAFTGGGVKMDNTKIIYPLQIQ